MEESESDPWEPPGLLHGLVPVAYSDCEESDVDKPAAAITDELDVIRGEAAEGVVLVPLPDEDNIDLYCCPVTHWWKLATVPPMRL